MNSKGILINAIINILNEPIRKRNEDLCKQNLFHMQEPLHGAKMFFKLAFLSEDELRDIATACGL